jgi:hypothetical protein
MGRLSPHVAWAALPRFGSARQLVVLGGAVLTAWALLVRPEPAECLRELRRLPLWLAITGIVALAVVKPAWEEMRC